MYVPKFTSLCLSPSWVFSACPRCTRNLRTRKQVQVHFTLIGWIKCVVSWLVIPQSVNQYVIVLVPLLASKNCTVLIRAEASCIQRSPQLQRGNWRIHLAFLLKVYGWRCLCLWRTGHMRVQHQSGCRCFLLSHAWVFQCVFSDSSFLRRSQKFPEVRSLVVLNNFGSFKFVHFKWTYTVAFSCILLLCNAL